MFGKWRLGRSTSIALTGLVVLLLLAATMPVALGTVAAQSAADEDMEAVVDAIWAEYASSIMDGSVERWVALWDENGVKMPPGGLPIEGIDELRARRERGAANWITDEMAITNLEVESAGDWAFARGEFTSLDRPAAGGDAEAYDGKYMTILRRQDDGTWKIYRDFHNSNVAPAAAAEPAAPPTEAEDAETEDVAAAINAIWREYESSLIEGDPDRWIALWAEDGVQMPPDEAYRDGTDVIRPANRNFLANFDVTAFAIDNKEVESADGYAFARGLYTMDFAPMGGGESIHLDGKYMTVFQQQADGTWKIYRDIFNAYIPPEPAAESDAALTPAEEFDTAVNAIWREYESSLLDGDGARWIDLWVEDGVQMPPDEPRVEGKEAINARNEAFLENFDITAFAIDNKEATVGDGYGYARGLYTVSFEPIGGGDTMHIDGKYMTIFQQQEDGSWKIYRDIFNSNGTPVTAAEDEDMEAVVDYIWSEYSQAVNTGDVERYMALWMDDGMQMPPGTLPVAGIENIRARRTAAANAFDLEMSITNLEVQPFGPWAFARGLYEVKRTPKDGGETTFLDGKYMSILRKQPDGSWKLYRDLVNSNVPPAPAGENVEAAINAVWREYESSLIEGDADRWIALWAEGGVQMPPGAPLVDGTGVIDTNIHAELEAVEYPEFAITLLEVIPADGYAIARGVYDGSYALKDGGDATPFDGKYMTLFQQQEDGSWKIYRDIFNSNEPPAPAEGLTETEAANAELSAELHARFSENDLEGALALAADDMELVAYGLGLDLKGKDKFMGFMQARKTAFPDITIEHINLIASGDQVAVEFIARGTHTGPLNTPQGVVEGTGLPITLHVMEVHQWQDGKLVRLVNYQDMADTLRQLGLMD